MIGIDISDKSIKLVQLSDDKNRRLLAYGGDDLPDAAIENGVIVQPKMVQDALLSMMKKQRISLRERHTIVASISETQSFLRVIEIPEMNEDEIGEAIQWEVAQHIPFGLENVYIDWQPLVGEGHKALTGRREVQVGAAQKKVVDPLYTTLKELGMDVAAFELESQALVRALVSPELRLKQGLLIVDLGASATNVIIHDHGALRFTATLQRGSSSIISQVQAVDAELLNTRPHEVPQEEADRLSQQLLPAMEELAIEVRGIVEFYNSIDAQHEVKEILMTGGGSNMPGLDKAFLKYFDNVHIQHGNPWVNLVSGQKAPKIPLDIRASARFTTAIGLALRQIIV